MWVCVGGLRLEGFEKDERRGSLGSLGLRWGVFAGMEPKLLPSHLRLEGFEKDEGRGSLGVREFRTEMGGDGGCSPGWDPKLSRPTFIFTKRYTSDLREDNSFSG